MPEQRADSLPSGEEARGRGADRRTRKARRRRMIWPGMGWASDSSDIDTAAAAGAPGEDQIV